MIGPKKIYKKLINRKLFGPVLLLCGVSLVASARATSGTVTADDYRREQTIISAIESPSGDAAESAVRETRRGTGLISTLSGSDLDSRLAKLLQWMVRDYANSGPLRLLSDLPEGISAKGIRNTHFLTLQKTFWLQNNSVYGAQALLEYEPTLGRLLSDSWRKKWEQYFPHFCPDTESVVVVGQLPAYENFNAPLDARCRLSAPGAWEFFRMHTYPVQDSNPAFDSLPKPIIGTDYPGDENGGPAELKRLSKGDARALLKYGCMRQVLLGNINLARQMFNLALAKWDGDGFANARNRPGGRIPGIYFTRDLAFTLICANALGEGDQQSWGEQHSVSKADIEQRLWAAQSITGGIWTNYCGRAAARCRNSDIPPVAKQTNEIAPLVLIAYGPNIWKPKHQGR